MMPGTQDKIAKDGYNVFCVHLVFTFEGFAVMGGLPMEKKRKLQWSHCRNLFLVRSLSENGIERSYD